MDSDTKSIICVVSSAWVQKPFELACRVQDLVLGRQLHLPTFIASRTSDPQLDFACRQIEQHYEPDAGGEFRSGADLDLRYAAGAWQLDAAGSFWMTLLDSGEIQVAWAYGFLWKNEQWFFLKKTIQLLLGKGFAAPRSVTDALRDDD